MFMVADARSNTKLYFDTYLVETNLTRDNGSDLVTYAVMYTNPDYPLVKEFETVDLLFLIGDPNSTPLIGHDQTPYGYEEHVPIETACIDKTGISGTLLRWKASAELRRITETYPTGSQRSLDQETPNEYNLGSTTVFSQKFVLNYRRATT